MILTMRAFTEGARALAMLTAFHIDLAHRHTDAEVKQNADDFVQPDDADCESVSDGHGLRSL